MTTYSIELQGDTLRVDFAKTSDGKPVPADGDQIVRDVAVRLNEMIASGELKGGSLLKINGRISVLASYTFAHHLAHLYRAIAVSDTRLGAYVVVLSTASEYPIGSRIDFETDEIQQVPSISDTTPSFLIDWQDDVLIAKINNGVQVDGDQIVRDAVAQLENLINSGQLLGGKQLLKINGRATVLASFIIAEKVSHRYSGVAVFDPKLGEQGLDKYVVTISHTKDYQLGETLEIQYEPQPTVKVVLCGSANTGKTVLRDGLKTAILKLNQAPADFYTISGCPDGDGSWYSETIQKYPDLAQKLKAEYKAKFTPEFAQAKAREIQAIKNSLLLFDVGGKLPSSENQIIMSQATHAIIVAKTEADVCAWSELCEQQLEKPLLVIAVIYSEFDSTEDKISNESPVLRGSVHHLQRGEDVSTRPMVQALANLLLKLTHS